MGGSEDSDVAFMPESYKNVAEKIAGCNRIGAGGCEYKALQALTNLCICVHTCIGAEVCNRIKGLQALKNLSIGSRSNGDTGHIAKVCEHLKALQALTSLS